MKGVTYMSLLDTTEAVNEMDKEITEAINDELKDIDKDIEELIG